MQNSILVLGSSGTIGSSIANSLSKKLKIIPHARNKKSNTENLKNNLKKNLIYGDLTKVSDVKKMFKRVEKKTDTLNAIVFCVGTKFKNKLTLNTEWTDFKKQYENQLKSFHIIMQNFKKLIIPKNKKKNSKIIVLLTEYLAKSPPYKIAPYFSAKSSLLSYCQILSRELFPLGVRIYYIAPGIIKSKMTSDFPDLYFQQTKKKITQPSDVSKLCKFLLSKKGNSFHDCLLPVNKNFKIKNKF